MSGHDHSHSHDHSHGFGHHHHEQPKLDHLNAAFIWGIILNSAFVIIEVVAGLLTGSLSLLTDAGHNLSDVVGLALALLAFKLTKVGSNSNYTYGYKRSTILVSFFNAVILVASIGIIVYEAVIRFIHPQVIEGDTIAWVSLIGIVINAFTAWLFVKDKDTDLNIKGAYLHMAMDAVVSLGVVIAGVIIYFTKLYWIDSVVSLIIAIVILRGTWSLLKDSLRLAMDGVPKEMNLAKIKAELKKAEGVVDVHHMHVWALSTTENALTAHLVIAPADLHLFDSIKADLRHRLLHLDINHSTFEPEFSNEKCDEPDC
ncbi:cation diffusion facilitator family transporter [Mucilaginibacter sp. UR6-11]|uniref:cation diffusion facilitator family transporter n=1 Tax=Mucilaginibacter sp. UR6-11 TaxID=1435644 RepID=UPI001E4F40A2|nr:cation diffusion facilitator family transporter [Mucilaginibacter sp. UR6-11]MCC8425686.1 cation diffusion facilitator family transporter [Mucilaginibacter sp. UR6-11]